MSARLLLLFAIAGFCSAALAMEPCSNPNHARNFETGEPCPTQPAVIAKGKPRNMHGIDIDLSRLAARKRMRFGPCAGASHGAKHGAWFRGV